jgi:hypothetical protein
VASFLRQILALALGIVLPLLLQRALLARMSEERRARGWSRVTWAFALYAVGPLSMIPFSWVTRRWRGPGEAARALALGVVWTAVVLGALSAIDAVYALVFALSD